MIHQMTGTTPHDCDIDCNSEMCHFRAPGSGYLLGHDSISLLYMDVFVVHCPSGLSSQMGLFSRCDFDVSGAKAFLRNLRHRTQ